MAQEINSTIDLTPLFIELFRTRADIRAFAKISLSEEDYKRFEIESGKQLKNIAEEFVSKNPEMMKGYSESLKNQQ